MKRKLLLILSIAYVLTVNAQFLPPSELQSYYTSVDFSLEGEKLLDDLATTTISKHSNILQYSERHNYLYNADEDLSNSSNVILMYSSESRDKREYLSGSNQHSPQTFNTEHVYPQSLIINTAIGDLHHLRACDTSINSSRGNNPFTDGSGTYNNLGSAWFPGDEWKGDVARMIMYLNLRYDESFADVGDLNLFLKWNREDPVSNFEKKRNEVIANVQGNRNPFIDNAYLATRIWGGDAAEDSWGIFTNQDDEAPTSPTNVVISNITTISFDVAWNASTDNESVSGYDVLLNGNIQGETSGTSHTVQNLIPNTNYAVTIIAKDAAKNRSTPSTAVNTTTLVDTTAPAVPINVLVSNQTGNSFQINWSASNDDSGILNYEVFLDGSSIGKPTATSLNVGDLTPSTTYAITVLAEDIANNKSALSTPVDGITTDGSNNISEIFFSEYVEGSGFNKAVELVNLTSNTIDLTPYTIKRQSNGIWEAALSLSGETIKINDVFVIINADALDTTLQSEADIKIPNVTPMTFNGDDRVGLFKDDILIDIIGELDGTDQFAANVTLRRNSGITTPSTIYNEKDWELFNSNTVSDIGNFNGTLSIEQVIFSDFKMYPNPNNGKDLLFNHNETIEVHIFNVLGKEITSKTLASTQKSIDISDLSKGIYLVKIVSDNQFISKKLIKD